MKYLQWWIWWLVVAVVLLFLLIGCTAPRWHLRAVPACADGLPVQILIDPRCPPDGICGYSCCPDRWATRIAEEAA